MLSRLMKYDLKKMIRFLSIFFLLALFFGALTRILGKTVNSLAGEIIKGICNGTAISMMCSLLINCFMRSWVLFRSSLFGDESYLTHTLPVKKETHYANKAFTAFFSLLFTMLGIIAVLFITYWTKELWSALKIPLEAFADYLNVPVWGMLLFLLAILFLEFFNGIQVGFFGILLGHRFHQGKILFSVIFGFAGYMLCQIVTLLGMLLISLFDSEFFRLFTSNDLMSFKPETIISVSLIGFSLYAFFCIATYFLNVFLLKKGVNVD